MVQGYRQAMPRWIVPGILALAISMGCQSRNTSDSRLDEATPSVEPSARHPADQTFTGDAAQGAHLFFSRGCSQCHTIGHGRVIGPDLKGVTRKYSKTYLERWIRDPDTIYREVGRSPINPGYPKMNPVPLEPPEIEDLLTYMDQQDRAGIGTFPRIQRNRP